MLNRALNSSILLDLSVILCSAHLLKPTIQSSFSFLSTTIGILKRSSRFTFPSTKISCTFLVPFSVLMKSPSFRNLALSGSAKSLRSKATFKLSILRVNELINSALISISASGILVFPGIPDAVVEISAELMRSFTRK